MKVKEEKGLLSCPYCGTPSPKALGACKVCGASVCANCGNCQITQEEGKVAVHNRCFAQNPEALSAVFRFLKIVK